MADKQKHQSNKLNNQSNRPVEDSASSALNQSSGIRGNLLSGQMDSRPAVDEGLFATSKDHQVEPTAVKPTRHIKKGRLVGIISVVALLLLSAIGLTFAYNGYRQSYLKTQKSKLANNIDTTSVDLANTGTTGIQGIGILQVNGDASISGSVTANTFNGSGADLTNLNANNITSGTLNDARLSANVALLDANQTFTGSNNFSGPSIFTGLVTLPGTLVINSQTYNLPTTQSAGALTNDGSGNLSWTASLACPSCIVNGGNAFGSTVIIGSTDAQDLNLITGGVTRVSFDTSGNASFTGTINGNGSGITSINGSNISSGTVADARLTSNVTLQGNVFNGALQLVQLDGAGALPALNGSALTNLNASNISSGTLNDARLSSNVPLLNAANVFSTTNTFSAGIVTNSIAPTGSLTIGSTTQAFVLQGTSASTITATSGPHTTTLGFVAPTTSNNIDIPNESGTICTTGSVCAGYAPASGANYLSLQATTPGTQQVGNANISGVIIAGSFSGNGANLTGLDATHIANGTLSDSRLSTNVTLQGNTFNTASKLVQLDGAGALPALNGSALTSLNASNISSGTLADARLSANVALLNGNQTFSGNNTFTGGLVLPGSITINSNAYNFPAVSAVGVLTNDGSGNLTWGSASSCPTCINNGGDSFGAAISIGTNDNNNLIFKTNNTTRLTFNTTGDATFTGAIYGDGTQLTGVAKLALNNQTFTGNNQVFQNASNSSSAFSVKTAGAVNVLSVDTASSTVTTAGLVATSLQTNTITPTGAMTIGSTSQNFTLQGGTGSTITVTGSGVGNTGTTTIGFSGSSTSNVTYNFDRTASSSGSPYTICTSAGNCAGVSGSVGTSGGTADKLAKFSSAYNIIDSIISDNGSLVTVGGSMQVDGSLKVMSSSPSYLNFNSSQVQVYDGATTTNYNFLSAGNSTYDICTSSGNCLGGGGGGANTSLSNLTSVAINTSLLPGSVNTIDLGSVAKPFRDIYIGTTATNNIKLTGSATASQTITFPDESGTVCTTGSVCTGYANNTLSNLGTVALNSTLQPASPGSLSLGVSTLPFSDLYLSGSSATPATNRFQLTGVSSGGLRVITMPDATGTICLENSASCGFASSSGSGSYIQNQTAVTQTAGFKINGTGTLDTLNAISAIQLNGTSINTGGTLSNVAYKDQANTFTAAGTALTVNNNATISGTLTSGLINGQNISSSANFTGTATVAGSSLTLGTASVTNGSVVFKNATNSLGLTLSAPNTTQARAIYFPDEDGTVCTTGSVCSGYAPSGSYANTNLSNLGTTAINSDLNFVSASAKSITGPGAPGLTVTNTSGNLTLSTTTSGTLALNSDGAANISAHAASTWSIGAANDLSIISNNLNLNTGGALSVGSTGSSSGSLVLKNSAVGSGSITLGANNTGASSYAITFPNETGTVCTTGSVCSGYAPSTGSTNYFAQNGNSFGANAILGTNDNFSLILKTNGSTRFTIPNNSASLNGSGNAAFTASANLQLQGGNSSAITIGNSSTSGTITIGGTAQTGNIDVGTGTGVQALNFGTGGTGAKTVTIGSTASTGATTLNAGSGGIVLGANVASNLTFASGASRTISVANGSGNSLSINAAQGALGFGSPSGNGGAVSITAGDAGDQSGASTTGNGGGVSITAGGYSGIFSGTSGGNGGNVSINGGSSNVSSSTGGSVNINAGTGISANGAINIGATTAASVSLGTAVSTGTITIGGTAQTGTIGIGTGTGVQTINLATGGTGAKTVTLGSTASTGSTTVQSGTGGIAITSAGSLTLSRTDTFATSVGFSGTPTGIVTYNFDRSATAGTYTVCTTSNNCLASGGGANQALSNLASVAINTDLVPGVNNSIDAGSSGLAFRSVYGATSMLTPLVDTISAGSLSVGTGTATGLTLGKATYTVSIPGGLTTNGSGITTAGGSLSTSNGSLSLGSGNITTSGTYNGNTFTGSALTFSGAASVSAGGTNTAISLDGNGSGAVNIGATSTGDINFGGGSGSTGCTVTNSNGNFACSGTGTFNGVSTGSMFINGGNSFGGAAILGTNDANNLLLETSNNVRFTINGLTAAGVSNLSGTGATTYSSTGSTTLNAAAGSDINIGALTTTGNIILGNSSMTTGSTTVRGGTGAGAISLQAGASGTIIIGTVNNNDITTGTGVLTVAGNANLNGNTTIGNATTDRLTITSQILGASPLAFQGATDDAFTTTFAITDPTANNTVTFRDGSGTVCFEGSVNCGFQTSGSYFAQGGNSFGTTASLGTNDANSLVLETNNTTRFTVDAAASTLTGNGATIISGGTSLALNGGAGGNTVALANTTTTGQVDIFKNQTNGTLTIGGTSSGATGSINIGTGTGAQTINFGTGGTGVKTIIIGGTAANAITIGDTQTAGSIAMGTAMTTGTIRIGGTGAQTGAIDIAPGTGAQAVNIGTGGTAAKTITFGNTSVDSTFAFNSGATTSAAMTLTTNSITSGTGLSVITSSTGLTGDLAKFESTGSDAGITGNALKVGITGATGTGTAVNITNAGTGLSFRVNDDGTYTDSTPMVVDANGNVGIGTATPGAKLEVAGSIIATGSTGFISSPYSIVAPQNMIYTGSSSSMVSIATTASSAKPAQIAFHPSGKYAYVANWTGSNVQAFTINSSTGALSSIATYASGASPEPVAVDPKGRFVYVGNGGSATVSSYVITQSTGALSVKTDTASGNSPFGVAADPSGRYVYVANYGSATIQAYSVNQTTGVLTSLGTTATGTNPYGVTVDPTGRFVYVANYGSANVQAYSINQTNGILTSIGTVGAGTNPISVAVDTSGKYAYVTNYGSNTIQAYTIDQSTGALTANGATVATGTQPCTIAIDPKGGFLYIANFGPDNIQSFSINPGTGQLTNIGTVSTGANPQYIGAEPTGRFVYSSNLDSSNLTAFTGLNSFAGGNATFAGTVGVSSPLTTGTAMSLDANALTTGNGLAITSTSTTMTGNALSVTTSTTSAPTNGLVRYNFSGVRTTAGNAFQIDDSATTLARTIQVNSNSLTTGTAMQINANALTTGKGLEISSTTTLTAGNLLRVANTSAGAYGTTAGTSGAVLFDFNGNHSGIGFQIRDTSNSATATAMQINAPNLVSGGKALVVNSGSTTGSKGLSIQIGGVEKAYTNELGSIVATAGILANSNSTQDTGGATAACYDAFVGYYFLKTCASSIRYKENVQDLSSNVDDLMLLRPVEYDWKTTGAHDLGIIAEEAEAVNPLYVTYSQDANGLSQVESVKYDKLVSLLIKGYQAHDSRITALEQGLSTSVLQAIADANAITINGTLTINGRTIFTNEVSFDQDTAGDTTVAAGDTTKHVSFSKTLSKKPVVNVTPQDFISGGYKVVNVTTTGFDVVLQSTQAGDVVFSWQALISQ